MLPRILPANGKSHTCSYSAFLRLAIARRLCYILCSNRNLLLQKPRRSSIMPRKRVAQPLIRMYSTTWCGDCRRSKRFLEAHHIPFEEINIEEDPQAAQIVISLNHGMRSVPTIVFPDGSVLVEPSNMTLASKLGIKLQG